MQFKAIAQILQIKRNAAQLGKETSLFGPEVVHFQADANLQMQEKQQRLVSKMTTKPLQVNCCPGQEKHICEGEGKEQEDFAGV